jgi:hypothetical protein
VLFRQSYIALAVLDIYSIKYIHKKEYILLSQLTQVQKYIFGLFVNQTQFCNFEGFLSRVSITNENNLPAFFSNEFSGSSKWVLCLEN